VLGVGISSAAGERGRFAIDYDVKAGGHDFVAHQVSGRFRYAF
jgi:outer membrane autotransporter protein